jgi:hypothetical protein
MRRVFDVGRISLPTAPNLGIQQASRAEDATSDHFVYALTKIARNSIL